MIIVISLGGSIIVRDKVNITFLKKFKNLILKSKHKFIIITGGGKVCRIYTNAGEKLGLSNLQRDMLGIDVTLVNARLVSQVLGKKAMFVTGSLKKVGKTPLEKIIVTGGFDPGVTTDYDAAVIAKEAKADMLINISDVKGVYDKDPDIYKGAKLFKKMSYAQFFKLFPIKYKPGMNFVFEPSAMKICQKNKIKVLFSEANINNLKKIFQNKKFIGTVIE
jgi:uridylate kinase